MLFRSWCHVRLRRNQKIWPKISTPPIESSLRLLPHPTRRKSSSAVQNSRYPLEGSVHGWSGPTEPTPWPTAGAAGVENPRPDDPRQFPFRPVDRPRTTPNRMTIARGQSIGPAARAGNGTAHRHESGQCGAGFPPPLRKGRGGKPTVGQQRNSSFAAVRAKSPGTSWRVRKHGVYECSRYRRKWPPVVRLKPAD